MDPISVLVGVGAVLLGQAIGYVQGRRHRAPKPIQAICGCGHGMSMHNAETERCHGMMNGDPLKYDSDKEPTAYKQVPCTCQRYVGPLPIDQVFSPPLLPPSDPR
ncbi:MULTISPECIES: hypothetical protein [unclassified Modestobacter]|uniref:hypothetical protein n=1 Tax=unclassified Modestobacter TaxID=2643866 RepID=UPI0022AAD305|nr:MULTISPECIES: hypothetical protein [unclassified Modestobacter]MCZ2823831.1 hypothetical protein [Modestobacter sp. VKM Ac-2981]MCZ2852076.1 hypothetical protein [Modestobacter sp. VKM Ac-2982]